MFSSYALAERFQSQLKLKILLSVVLNLFFLASYQIPQKVQLFKVEPAPSCPLDSLVPFVPGTVYLYESFLLLLPIGPWLMDKRDELVAYGWGIILMCTIAFAVFMLWPTAAPRPQFAEGTNAAYDALIRLDGPLNSFPSLHVAMSVFSAMVCHMVFAQSKFRWSLRLSVWIWTFAVAVSTVTMKQHVILDAVSGAALGLACYALVFRRIPSMRIQTGRDVCT